MKILQLCLILFALLFILLTGCPRPDGGPGSSGIDPANILPIPPLDTVFVYEGESLNWDIPDHPRIMARPEGIQFLKDNPDSQIARTLIGAAEMNRDLAMSDPNFMEATAPLAWAWGYILTNDPTYLDLVRGLIPVLTQFPPIVKVPEGANIPFLQQALALGGVYDLLYYDLSETERAQIESVLRDTVFHTLAYKVTEYDHDINFWANDPDTNYYVTFHSTAGLVAIALGDVEPDAKELAEHCWLRIQDSMHAFSSENGWREGLTYHDICWGQFACYFLLALERSTDLEPHDEPLFTASIPWAMWGALPDNETVACFGDNEPENYSVGSWLYRVGVLTGDDDYIRHAQLSAITNDMALDLPVFHALCIGREHSGPIMDRFFENQSITRHMPGLEWAYIRTGADSSGWTDENDFYLAFKSGTAGQDHNHLDQGSMILAAYSEILLSDPGRGGPDIIRQDPALNCLFEAGLGHNTLIVGDGCYMDLELFPDNPDYFAEHGSITSIEETDEYVQYTTDNSGLYPTEPLVDFRRTFIYIKPGVIDGADLGALVIADRVEFSSDVEHSCLFHTPGEVELLENGRARLVNGSARLDYYGDCTVATVDKSERQETTWDIRDSTCYFRSTDGPARASDWIHVLIPMPAMADESPSPVFTRTMMGTVVEWDDYSFTLMLNPNTGWVVGTPPG